ncbi:hypothetical protein DL93DRAFT_359023 [Clavulina sp. PMI_390]|nr:hypothetical protein DL93DRAFT_359023 [Clavulina sp. PMI_390]
MTSTATQRAYYWLNIVGGWIILPIIILTTLLSRRTRKSPLLMNLYCIWTYEAILAALLFVTNKYSLKQGDTLVPRIQNNDPLCVAQAVMFEGTTTQMSAAALAVVLNVTLIMRSITRSSSMDNTVVTYGLILYPHLSYIVIIIPFLITAIIKPGTTSPHQFYCAIDLGYAPLLTGVVTFINAVVAIILQVWNLIVLRKEHRKVFSRSSLNSSIIFRVLLFTTVQLIALILTIITIDDFTAVTPDMMVSTSPILVALIFGTQKDLLNAWYTLFTTDPCANLASWWNGTTLSQSGSHSHSRSQSQTHTRTRSRSQSQSQSQNPQHSRRGNSVYMQDHPPLPSTSTRRTGSAKPFQFTPGSRSESGLDNTREGISLPTYPPTSASSQRLRPREANYANDNMADFFEMMDKSRIPGIPRRPAPGPIDSKQLPDTPHTGDSKHIDDLDVEVGLQGKSHIDLDEDEDEDDAQFLVSLEKPTDSASLPAARASTAGDRSSVVDVLSSLSSYRRQHAISFDPAASPPDRDQDRGLPDDKGP